MSAEFWAKGYKDVKNVIHNEIGVTKEDIIEIFRKIAKEEVQKIVSEKRTFVQQAIREVIREEMVLAVNYKKYPQIRKNIWDYTSDNGFKDYITGVMKEEIVDSLNKQFELNFDIKKVNVTI